MQKINHIFVKKIKMKHTEPKIGQLVYVINKDIFVRVIDKESIEGITLFYTDDNLSYIEEQLYYIYCLGVNGLFTEFPDRSREMINLSNNYTLECKSSLLGLQPSSTSVSLAF